MLYNKYSIRSNLLPISNKSFIFQELDDDDLLAELEELEQEELDSEMLNIPSSSQEPSLNLPTAPTKAPAAPAAQAVDDDLADLEQWMAN